MFLSTLPGTATVRALAAVSLVLAITIGFMPVANAQTGSVIPPSENHRWMAAMAAAYPKYGELLLSEALFPGAHDAGTFDLNAAFAPDIPALAALQFTIPLQILYPQIKSWAKTQNVDFTAQLNGGVRYLDLRLCAPIIAGDPVRFCHGLYGTTLESGLNQIASFASDAAHSKEILIVHVAATHAFSDALKASTKQLIKTKLGSLMYPLPANGARNSLQTVWNSGKNIIVLSDADGEGFWSGGWLSSPWPGELDLNSDTTKRHDMDWLEDTVVANLACRCNSGATTPTTIGNHMFFGLQVQSTSNVLSQILDIGYQLAYPFGTQEGATNVTSGSINPLVLDTAHLNQNVIIGDFATEHGFVENIKNLTVAKLDLLHGKVARRAYLSRTESPELSRPAVVTTSSNGTHFGYTTRMQNGAESISAGYPALVQFGDRLFAGDTRVTSIQDDFLKTPRTWINGSGFAVNLTPSGLPPGATALPASYAQAYGKFYMAWTAPNGTMHYRSSPDGVSFPPVDVRATGLSSASIPVLTTRMGMLYLVWMSPANSLDYALIESDGTLTNLGAVAGNLQARPAVTGFGTDLLFAWSDRSDRKIRVLAVNPATGMESPIVTLQDTTDAPPSLAVFKGSVVLAYTGQNKRRYTLVSADGETFPDADRAVEEPAFESNLTPPTLHAWGDRAIVAVTSMVNADGSTYTPGAWTRHNVTVTFSCEAPVAGVHGFLLDNGDFVEGDTVSVTVSTVSQPATVRCVDLSGHAVSATATVKFDRTPPQISYLSSTPARPASGWYKTDVIATFGCVDHESGAVQSHVSDLLNEGKSQLAFATCVDVAGNSATTNSSEFFNIDKTAPAIFVRDRLPAPNAHGWNNTSVNVSYFITDSLSGVDGPGISGVTFSTDGANQHRVVTVKDIAGNTADLDIKDPAAAINVDRTAPTLTVPANFTVKKTGQGPFAVTFSTSGSDALSGALPIGCTPASGSLFAEGTTAVSCTISDKAGNTTTKSFSITVAVNKAPEISAVTGGPIDEGGSVTLSVSASDPDVSDALTYEFDCNADGVYELTPQVASTAACVFADSGSRTVNVRVTDPAGAIDTAATVIVVNNVAPSATFANSGPVDEGASFTLSLAGVTDPSSADMSAGFDYSFNCGDAYAPFSSSSTIACPTAGSGSISVHGKVRDKDGGEREYSASVTINGVPPAITVPASITVPATRPDGAVVTFEASALDALDGSVAVSCSPASGSVFPLGTTAVTCTAADTRGNDASKRFDVSVNDVTAPRLTLPANFVTEAALSVTYAATASDDVDGVVEISCAPLSGFVASEGANTVECTARDAAGNLATGAFVVTGVDSTGPVVTIVGNSPVEVGLIAQFTATAHDRVSGDVPVTCSIASGFVTKLGGNPVTCMATDAAGNIGETSFTIAGVDTTRPVVSVPADITVEAANAAGAVASYTVTSSDAPNTVVPQLSCSKASGTAFPIGVTVVTCTARDASGNAGTASFSVTVGDITTPGSMHGAGFVREDGTRYDFGFRVEERGRQGERGNFTLEVRDERRRKGRSDVDRFVARDISFIAFSDDPTHRPGRPKRPHVDTVRFSGTGSWNGRSGYRFEVLAADEGEPGRHRESISITIWSPSGAIVIHVEDTLSGGNVQSKRIRH